jgi:DNA-directed RNA polymerase specialized sigma subunit
MNPPDGGSRSEDVAFLEFLPLARVIATSIWRRLPDQTELEDLMQAASAGLQAAISTFDSTTNVPFACFAKARVRGAVLDHLSGLTQGRPKRTADPKAGTVSGSLEPDEFARLKA